MSETAQSKCSKCGSISDINDPNHCPRCGNVGKNISISVCESVGITETVFAQLELYFELVSPIAVPKDFKNSNEITLCVNDESVLQSFRIKCSTEDNGIISAIHKANRFVNYLSFQTGLYVSHKQPRKVIEGKIITKSSTSFTIDTVLTNLSTLDLTDSNLDEFLSNTSIDNLGLAHFASGQRALDEQNYPEAIREFYLTIEDSGIQDENKYKKLRNAVSHTKIDDSKSPDILKDEFDIDLPRGGSLDILDPIIIGKLEISVKKLRDISWQYVSEKNSDLTYR